MDNNEKLEVNYKNKKRYKTSNTHLDNQDSLLG